jgi:succinate-semialdehyde dehydrogenase/glutarate-semialdehyde dehydrogenase
MNMESINPTTQKVIAVHESFSDEQVKQCLVESEKQFLQWHLKSMDQRATLLFKVAELLLELKTDLGKTITLEMGKPIKEAVAEIEKCAWVCKYYANNGAAHLQTESITTEAYSSYVSYEPLGCILGIMPWNFPFWQVFRFLAPSLMAGNVALLKHASNVQLCALKIEEVLLSAGIPKGVFQRLVIGSDMVEGLIKSPVVKAVTLTGSELAGAEVASTSGRQIKKTVLELGGSNAFIVLKDADIDKAVKIGIAARMMNAGQSCIAGKRFILLKEIADEFIQKYVAAVKQLKVGDPFDETVKIGPLASIKQAREVESQVNDSISQGAKLLIGGKRDDAFYWPTVLSEVKPGMVTFDEEVFGPVAPMIISDTLEEAVELSNQSRFGLGVSIITSHLEKAEKLVHLFKEGAVFINSLVKSDPRLPFGGIKMSGYGRELSKHGIREFVNAKTVYIEKM